jgi:hypothetical protein
MNATGGGAHRNIRDTVFGFAGEFVTGDATISFTISDNNSPVTYTSDPGGQINPGPPGVGHERNGFFFSH